MPPSLRKRISKRSPHKTERKVTFPPGSSSPLLAALDHLQKPPTVSQESLDAIPPPSIMLPREPDNVRCSPSKSLLQRYRGRTSSENAALATSTRDAPVTRSRSRDTAFTEDFGDVKKRSSSPKSMSNSIKSTIRKVGGVDFEMLNATHSPLKLPKRSKSAEPARARSPAESDDSNSDPLFGPQHTSRSQTREKERSDSTIDHDALTLSDVLALKAKEVSAGSENTRAQSPQGPRVLQKKNSDPSIATRPKIPRVTRSTAAAQMKNAILASETIKPVDSDSGITTDSTSSDSDSSSDCTFTLDTTSGNVGRSPRKSDPGPQPIQVIPPINVGDILPGLLWASPLSGTSRPDSPWLWCKRWTCCQCKANTIVEQKVCARLTCGHQRCGKRCKVARDKRVFTA